MHEHPAILAQNLNKNYTYFEKEEGLRGSLKVLFARKMNVRRAVIDYSFVLPEGQIMGLIGPNGAGKTTLIKILTGILQPSSGNARVLGYDPSRSNEPFKKQIALVMGQKSQLWWDLPAIDTFLLNQSIYEIPEAAFRRSLASYVALFEIGNLLNVPVRQLSLGERMKMELIASLLHSPRILFLDEPTIGLDAIAQRQMRELIREVNLTRAVTVLLTSHYMEDIHSLCKDVMVIRKGQKIYEGSLEQLLDRYKSMMTVHIQFASDNGWKLPPDVQCLEHSPHHLNLSVPKGRVHSLLQEALSACDVSDISVIEEDLGSLVEKIYHLEGEPGNETIG